MPHQTEPFLQNVGCIRAHVSKHKGHLTVGTGSLDQISLWAHGGSPFTNVFFYYFCSLFFMFLCHVVQSLETCAIYCSQDVLQKIYIFVSYDELNTECDLSGAILFWNPQEDIKISCKHHSEDGETALFSAKTTDDPLITDERSFNVLNDPGFDTVLSIWDSLQISICVDWYRT